MDLLERLNSQDEQQRTESADSITDSLLKSLNIRNRSEPNFKKDQQNFADSLQALESAEFTTHLYTLASSSMGQLLKDDKRLHNHFKLHEFLETDNVLVTTS